MSKAPQTGVEGSGFKLESRNVEDIFEMCFPKTHERPGIQPYKQDIKAIVLDVVREVLKPAKRIRHWDKYHGTQMPYYTEL